MYTLWAIFSSATITEKLVVLEILVIIVVLIKVFTGKDLS